MTEKFRNANGDPSLTSGQKIRSERGKSSALRWDDIAPFADAGFRAVFDSSAEALLVIDPAGMIQKANQRARS